ncbi:head-tail connector protein [Sphingomonas arenae]|uniref:head-tail connector protein n=1 Tax=Sphingomonas arenae TaxID=2812555 RepID=UPI0019672E16|nr:hypothetical protein [Sphingomonas arenae]
MGWLGRALPAVSVSEAQAYVRVETGEEEAILAGLIRTATELCEAFLNQVVVARSFEEELVGNGGWQQLRVAPVRSIEGVERVDAAGVHQALVPGEYSTNIDRSGEGWVRIAAGERGVVRGTAGLASDGNEVPEPLRQGVLRLVAHLFASRDGSGGEPPAAVTALWRPYRRLRLR